jgi:hypothetical protein
LETVSSSYSVTKDLTGADPTNLTESGSLWEKVAMVYLPRTAASLLVLPAVINAVSLDCKHIRVDGQSFHFDKLGGPKEVYFREYDPPNIQNTTFTIDICAALKIDDKIEPQNRCDPGTRICAINREYRQGVEPFISTVIPIAGDYSTRNGRHIDPIYTRLNGSDSHSDAKLEGVRAELHGGQYKGKDQKAIIEFICDKEMEGNEGFKTEASVRRRQERVSEDDGGDEDKEDPLPDLNEGKAIQFISFGPERDGKVGVLRLTWKTKYACESQAGEEPDGDDKHDGEGKKSSGWGFFTWFLIIAFLLAAAYIIFGSWLNYNRYGARGWDLIPHGDTIRDLPYILKDWFSGIAGRFSGSDSSRGGYSAV